MGMDSALSNPATALHVLSYKASLPVLVAMFMPDCPTPVSVRWLMHRTGVKARKTMNETLDYLAYLGIIAQIMTANKGWWALTDRGRQLPLPFAGSSLAASTQSLPASSRVTILGEESTGASTQLPLPQSTAAESRWSTQSAGAIPAMVANSGSDPEAPPIVSKIYSPPPLKELGSVVVFKNNSNPDRSFCEQQHFSAAGVSKFYPPPPTADFLREIGMGEPVPTDFGDYPLSAALAYWWFALAQGMSSPQGYLRRRLEQGHGEPPADYLQLAELWLGLSGDERADLWAATTDARAVHGGISLPPDFDRFVPFKPLLRLGAAWRKNRAGNGDLVFVPDCLAWEDGETSGDYCRACGEPLRESRCLFCDGIIEH